MTKSTRELVVVQPNPNGLPEPLTYYDPELQNAWNVEPFDAERLQRAQAKSERSRREYAAQLTKLRNRLSGRTYARFAAEHDPLFDSNLFEFTFGDAVGFAKKTFRQRMQTSVRATFLSFDMKTLHELTYRKVELLRVNVPTERWFEMGGYKEIDSLLAHELTAVGDSLMRHKFLFASGAAILLTFAQMTWDTRMASRQVGKR